MAQVRQHLQAFPLRHHGPIGAFALAGERVGIYADHQDVAVGKRLLKVARVSLMEHIVDALGEHNAIAHALEIVSNPFELFEIRNKTVFKIRAGRKDIFDGNRPLLHAPIESRILTVCNPAPVSSPLWAATGYSARITACFGISRRTSSGLKL